MATRAAAPRAQSLHIGLNGVSAAAYSGWDGPLAACEFDANDMAALAKAAGIKSTVLLTKKATRAAVLAGLAAAAKALKSGDFFFLTYSGHGGQVPDTDGDEPDRKDETWCLYDGQMLDDELYVALGAFAQGVRVLVLSDSCHSGTVTRERVPETTPQPGQPAQRSKAMPDAVAYRVYRDNKSFYDGLQADLRKAAAKLPTNPDAALAQVTPPPQLANNGRITSALKVFRPAVILISGCQDNQTSMDGQHNGAFTEQLLKVWNHGLFKGSYPTFHQQIRARLPATQSPNLFTLGDTAKFLVQQPFSL